MLRFVLFGFPVRVHAGFWLVSLLLAQPTALDRTSLVRAATWMSIVFVSILVHELGHAFAMRAFGRSASVDLVAMGGYASWGEGPRVSGFRRALVSLAGPGAGFAFALLVVGVTAVGPKPEAAWAREAMRAFLWVNVGWGVVNLLPVLPLDGGRVLQAALVGRWGETGGKIARASSLALGVLIGLAALRFEMLWIAFLAGTGVMQTYGEKPVADASIPATGPEAAPADKGALNAGWTALWQGEADDAAQIATAALATVAPGVEGDPIRARLLELVAWAELDRGDDDAARAAVSRIPIGTAPSGVLIARIALERARTTESLRALEDAFWEAPSEHGALVVAMAHLDAGDPASAVTLFRRLDRRDVGRVALHRIGTALFYAGRYEVALELEELGWDRHRDPTFAYNAACSLARLGRVNEGLRWLSTAVDAGFVDLEMLTNDDDLGALRADHRFQAIVARAGRAGLGLGSFAASPLECATLCRFGLRDHAKAPHRPRRHHLRPDHRRRANGRRTSKQRCATRVHLPADAPARHVLTTEHGAMKYLPTALALFLLACSDGSDATEGANAAPSTSGNLAGAGGTAAGAAAGAGGTAGAAIGAGRACGIGAPCSPGSTCETYHIEGGTSCSCDASNHFFCDAFASAGSPGFPSCTAKRACDSGAGGAGAGGAGTCTQTNGYCTRTCACDGDCVMDCSGSGPPSGPIETCDASFCPSGSYHSCKVDDGDCKYKVLCTGYSPVEVTGSCP